ncbi:MAG: Na+/H+ antiporter NhaA [Gammaproteobacteria bacterium]|nr:Na+/H+ antiporter NhaA [Gammaproteobacteria bacterium]MBT8444115.1 Na+/H+ antiporter NhaA [Gammaproteobacteria bacterium]
MVDTAGSAIYQFGDNVRRFVRLESAGGIVLFAAAVAAMAVKNSPLAEFYAAFLTLEGEVRLGAIGVEKPLFLWVNDGLMAIFFLLVSMEIKREVIEGHLRDRQQLVLPCAGAAGGIIVPALIYAALNSGDPFAIKGWAIPTATDIAFALGVLALLGSRIPVALKVLLMTLAVVDDLAAIIVIALFYTSNLSFTSLALAAGALLVLATLNRLRVSSVGAYVLVGVVLWVCVLKSGVHATLAGVAVAFAIPCVPAGPNGESPFRRLVARLHPWVAFGILPLFAFVNSGIALQEINPTNILGPVPVGIVLGLFLGKQLGVFSCVWLAIRLRLAAMPAGVSWAQIYGVSILCGIGFTMSLFIGALAFAEGGAGYARVDRLGIIGGSLLSGIVGYLVLRFAGRGAAISDQADRRTVHG